MARVMFTVLFGLVLLVLESIYVAVFVADTWIPHMAAGLVLYLALKRTMFEGAVCLIMLAWIADLMAAAPPGVVALSMTVVFFGVWLLAQSLALKSWPVRLALSVVVAALVQVLGIIIVMITVGPEGLWGPLFLSGLPSSLMAPVGALCCWGALWWVDKTFAPRQSGLLTPLRG